MAKAHNPYGGGPGTGVTLPDYYRPTLGLTGNSESNSSFSFPNIANPKGNSE